MPTRIEFRRTDGFRMCNQTHGEDLQQAELYAQTIQAYSHAEVTYVSVTLPQDVAFGAQSAGDFDDIGLYAQVMCRSLPDLTLYGVLIPAPKSSMFETLPNGEYRVRKEVGDAIAAAYSALAGHTFIFAHGKLCGDSA